MSEQPFNENGLIDWREIDWREYEIVPDTVPENETPRQFVLRVTGKDFPDLAFHGRDFTWQEIRDVGALPIIDRIVQIASLPPRIVLRKKQA